MTIAPHPPMLDDGPGTENKTLLCPHLTFIDLILGYTLAVYIKAGFITDGASVPNNIREDTKCKNYIHKEMPELTAKYDIKEIIEIIVGEAWDMPRLLAAIVHDALYGMKWMFRWVCDKIYKLILCQYGYSVVKADIEYYAIRLLGGQNWDAISDLEKARTRNLVTVKLIRAKNKGKVIQKLMMGNSF